MRHEPAQIHGHLSATTSRMRTTSRCKYAGSRKRRLIPEAGKNHFLHRIARNQLRHSLGYCDLHRLIDREAVDPATDGRECQ